MAAESSVHELIDELADDFVRRRQGGEDPSVSEYCQRYPQLEREIRDLFPTLAMLEQVKTRRDEQDHQEPHPDVVGDYHIVREIGRGGMGIVYEAEQRSLGRRVALKVLARRTWIDDAALTRFKSEARATAKLHHTNIVPLFEVGEEGGHYFHAMQLIGGQSLDTLISTLDEGLFSPELSAVSTSDFVADMGTAETKRSSGSNVSSHVRQPYRRITEIGLQVAEALAYAHARGIVHRDIKPSNLLLDESGTAWVTDFGLAKMDEEDLTRDGDFVGTLRYMSPERFRGECDHRADIYGLGLTLYEMLARRSAFESDDRLRLIDHINKTEPTALHVVDPRVPRDLETIVVKAIDKEPSARYATADALADDLRRFLADQPIKARRHSLAEQLYRWGRRNKGLAAALTALAGLLTAIIGVLAIANIREAVLRQQAESAQQVAEHRGEELTRNLYFAEMNLAGQATLESFGAATISSLLDRWRPQQIGIELRDWEWYYLYSLVHRESFSSGKLEGWTFSADFSPDGSRVAAAVYGFGWKIWDADTGRLIREKQVATKEDLSKSPRFVRWSPDGKLLAVTDYKGDVTIWDATTGSRNIVFNGPDSYGDSYNMVYSAAWSPDGKRLVSCDYATTEPVVWDVATGEKLQTLRGHSDSVRPVIWSPNGTRLASTSTDGTARIWDAQSGRELMLLQPPIHDRKLKQLHAICWSPDGKKIATGGRDAAIRVWNAESGEPEATLDAGHGIIYDVQWRPAASHLASGHEDGTVRLWDVESARQLRNLKGHANQVRSISWNSSGTRLVSSGLDRTVRIWILDALDQTQLLYAVGWGHHLDWSADGQRLASGSSEGGVHVWHTSTGTGNTIFTGERIDAVDWRPDGSRLAIAGHDSSVQLWNTSDESFQLLQEASKQVADFNWWADVAWNHDGSLLATTSPGKVTIWNARTARKLTDIAVPHHPGVLSVDWNYGDTRLAIGSDATIEVWDVAANTRLWRASKPSLPVIRVRWSPSTDQLATAHDGAILIWDGNTGTEERRMEASFERYRALDWSPDAKQVITGNETSLSVWNVAAGKIAVRLPTQRYGIYCVRWSADGRRIAAGCTDDAVRILDATRGYLLAGPK